MTPDELVEKVARAIEQSLLTSQLRDAFEHPYTAEARAAIAAINAWEGCAVETYDNGERGVFLPLPQKGDA